MPSAGPEPLDEPVVIDVGEASFDAEVLDRSRRLPVVVDFWAPWCGPCRSLAPLLERLAQERAGELTLAKLNVDEAPELGARYGARSIPLVIGFRDGEPRDHFVGAQPESAIRAFLARLLPDEADRLAAAGDAAREAGQLDRAEEHYRAALAARRGHAAASLGLASLLGDAGDGEAALRVLEEAVADGEMLRAVERLAATLRTGRSAADLPALEAAAAAAPDDPDAQLAYARGLAASGRHADAFERMLGLVRTGGPPADEARRAMLDLFEILGGDHELTREYRGQLARALYR